MHVRPFRLKYWFYQIKMLSHDNQDENATNRRIPSVSSGVARSAV